MYRKTIWLTAGLGAALLVAGCEGEKKAGPSPGDDGSARWYSEEQVSFGRQVFDANCAQCHGGMAQGASDWREQRADGAFPPPPLNGRGHAWHHPYGALKNVVTGGGPRNMPAFGGRLEEEEVDAVLAYINSLWPDQIYRVWVTRVNGG